LLALLLGRTDHPASNLLVLVPKEGQIESYMLKR
jgi:hypothetical protein